MSLSTDFLVLGSGIAGLTFALRAAEFGEVLLVTKRECDDSATNWAQGGMAAVLETRLHQAQAEPMTPIDLLSTLVSDELTRRSDRLLDRRRKEACFRDANRTLDNFDFAFNPKMNRSLIFDLATCAFIGKREDALSRKMRF